MKHTLRVVVVLTSLAAITGLTPCATAEAANEWIEMRSTNFLLAGNASERDIREVARRLEEFREALSRLLPRARLGTRPTVVLVFGNQKSYEPFKPLYEGRPIEASGVFQSGRDVNYVTMALDGRQDPYPIVFHEFTHLFVEATLEVVPLWLGEGLAEYYSSFSVSRDGKQATVGNLIDEHVQALREHWLPLDMVLSARHDSALYNESRDRHTFYCESWALVHYLLLGGPARTAQLSAFIGLLGAGAPPDQAFRDAFDVSPSLLEDDLHAYVRRDRFPVAVVPFTQPIASRAAAKAQPLGEAAVEARLGDLLLHMNREKEAEARLQHALQLDPANLPACLSLAEVRLREKNGGDALEILGRALTIDAGSFAALTAYGEALLRRLGKPSADAIETGRKAFARALEIRPDSPDALAGLAWAHLLADDRLNEGQRLAERAVQLDPSEPDYALLLAELLAHQRNFAAARARLGLLMASARPEVRERARTVMGMVAEYEKATTPPPGKEAVAAAGGITFFLRAVKDGEQRVFGALDRIECGLTGTFFVVNSGGRSLRLSVAGMDTIEFTTYREELKGVVACGPRQPPDPVYATYRPAGAAGNPAAADGEAVAIEFMPKNYVPR